MTKHERAFGRDPSDVFIQVLGGTENGEYDPEASALVSQLFLEELAADASFLQDLKREVSRAVMDLGYRAKAWQYSVKGRVDLAVRVIPFVQVISQEATAS